MTPQLLSTPDVWMEGSATEQLARVAARPGCVRAVGMPDLHAGLGSPIGVALAFENGVFPALIGGDAGCGARLVGLPKERAGGLDALERRVRELTEAPTVEVDEQELLAAAWSFGPKGLASVAGVPEALQEIALLDQDDPDPPSGPVPVGDFGASLGTIGGGNHFLELSEVEHVADKTLAKGAGLVAGGLAIVAHSGSRGLGKVMADQWPEGPLTGDSLRDWQGTLAGLCRYARTNRLLLVWKLLRALGAAKQSRLGGMFDIIHNTVVPMLIDGQNSWLHRKGCAPADLGQLTVVLGSRGARSYVMEGLGCEAALCSVAHGAGRKMTRTEATAKIRARYTRASLTRTSLGGRVICDDNALLYEEHPDAYKPIEAVIEALEMHKAARRLCALRPMLTIKR